MTTDNETADTDDTTETETETESHPNVDLLTEVRLVELDDLQPYVNNPKEHPDDQVEKIASSIKQYGMDQPIVVDGDGEIIKGHGRYQAVRDLGLERVPVIWRDQLPPSEVRGARLADNKTTLDSGWDVDTLAAEFEALEAAPEFDIEDTGFDTGEVDAIIDSADFDIDEFFEDDDPDPDGGDTTGEDVPSDLEVECPSCGHGFWPEGLDLDEDTGVTSATTEDDTASDAE